jgi:hypothetical protein
MINDNVNSARPRNLRSVALLIIGGVLLASAGVLLFLVAPRGEQLAEVSYEILAAAKSRWQQRGVPNYDLEIVQSGVNPGLVNVSVRDGIVEQASYNGRPLRQHSWDDWSVPGLFGVIRQDLDVCATANHKAGSLAPVFSRGKFDAQYGYPLIYRRITPTGDDAQWTVQFRKK